MNRRRRLVRRLADRAADARARAAMTDRELVIVDAFGVPARMLTSRTQTSRSH